MRSSPAHLSTRLPLNQSRNRRSTATKQMSKPVCHRRRPRTHWEILGAITTMLCGQVSRPWSERRRWCVRSVAGKLSADGWQACPRKLRSGSRLALRCSLSVLRLVSELAFRGLSAVVFGKTRMTRIHPLRASLSDSWSSYVLPATTLKNRQLTTYIATDLSVEFSQHMSCNENNLWMHLQQSQYIITTFHVLLRP